MMYGLSHTPPFPCCCPVTTRYSKSELQRGVADGHSGNVEHQGHRHACDGVHAPHQKEGESKDQQEPVFERLMTGNLIESMTCVSSSIF